MVDALRILAFEVAAEHFIFCLGLVAGFVFAVAVDVFAWIIEPTED